MYPNALSVVSSIFPHLSHLKILAIFDICDVQTEKDIYKVSQVFPGLKSCKKDSDSQRLYTSFISLIFGYIVEGGLPFFAYIQRFHPQ
jgi:hypothetical protein